MKNKKSILIVGKFDFPHGNSNANLVLNNAKILKENGYNVFLMGCSKNVKINDDIFSTKIIYDGIEGCNVNYPQNIKEWLSWKVKYKQFLKCCTTINNLQAVILFGAPCISYFCHKVMKYCRKNNIKVISHVVDWMPYYGKNLFVKFAKTIDNDYRMRFLNKKMDGVIVVSEYLYEYYSKSNNNTILIPPLVDSAKLPKCVHSKEKTIKFIYFGDPFPLNRKKLNPDDFKDRLDILIDMFSKLNADVSLHIYGLTLEQYLKYIPQHKKIINNNIKFFGRVTHEQLLKKIIDYDFLIFLRTKNKMTSAGFPSKLTESYGCGIPIITSDTSDINRYLEDGKNGFFLEINDQEKLEMISKLSKDEIKKQKDYIIKTNLFDYHNYINLFKKYLERIIR